MPERINRLLLSGETWSAPAICDFDGRSVIAAADCEGGLSAFDGNTFEPLWQRRLGGGITASPVVADWDGEPVILVGTHERDLFAINAKDGSERWRHRARGMIRAPVAVVNVRGVPRVVLASYGPELTILSANGEVQSRWRRPKHVFQGRTKTGIVCAPLVYDVDGDGEPEIVSGGRSPWVVCYDMAGRPKWFHRLRYDTDSTPSFAVVDGVPVVLIGGGEHTGGRGDNALIALDGRDGRELWRAPVGGAIDASPMIARLPTGQVVAFCGTLASHKIVAVDLADGALIWMHRFGPTPFCAHSAHDPQQPDGDDQCRRSDQDPYFTAFARCRSYVNPLIADIDSDGRLEVVTGSNNGTLVVLDAETGAVRFQEDTGGMVRGSFALSDVDRDGRAELIVPSGNSLIVYRVLGNPPATQFYKGRGDMLGADHEPMPAPGPARPARRFVRLEMSAQLLGRDVLRHIAIQFDKYVLRRAGASRFDYYY